MNITKKLLAVTLALVLVLSMAGTVSADENEDAVECIQQMIAYYLHHQEAANADIEFLLRELALVDPKLAEKWTSIMDYWSYVNTDFTQYPGVLPDGLPQDDSLCIVVMGYELATDGSMKNELIGRLGVALASAKKYPNAYVVCTGGGTARYDTTVTEAGQMARWLNKKGIAKERIIVEDQALSTVSNAINTYEILEDSYPQITHLALITSDYHLARSCLLFHAQVTLGASEEAPPLCVAANAAYRTFRSGSESIESQADNLSQLSKIPIYGLPEPDLSTLESISVSGGTQSIAGSELSLQVIAHYDTGFYRDVSNKAKFSGIDLAAAGVQNVTISYEEGGITASTTVQIELLAPETEPPTEAPTEAPTEPAAELLTGNVPAQPVEIVPDKTDTANEGWVLPSAIIALLLIAEFFAIKRFLKIRKQHKAAKAAEKAEATPLPGDDSPLEYT